MNSGQHANLLRGPTWLISEIAQLRLKFCARSSGEARRSTPRHQDLLLKSSKADVSSFEEYVAAAPRTELIQQIGTYLEELDHIVRGQYYLANHSKELDQGPASLFSELAATMTDMVGDIQKLHSRLRDLEREK
jgi:hypothetical protein